MDRYIGIDVRAASCTNAAVDNGALLGGWTGRGSGVSLLKAHEQGGHGWTMREGR
jgi:hypothetical protein